MLIKCFRNNDTQSISKTLARNQVPRIKLKSYMISPREICKNSLTSRKYMQMISSDFPYHTEVWAICHTKPNHKFLNSSKQNLDALPLLTTERKMFVAVRVK